MNAKASIYTIVPNLNGAEYLAEALTSLEQQTTASHIVVVDNASTDDSVEIIKSGFPNVTLLTNEVNTGFTGGVNRGIQYALDHGAGYVALFNNDAVAEPTWLAELIAAMKHADIAASLIMQYDDRSLADSSGDFLSKWGVMYPRDRDKKPPHYADYPVIFGASGGSVMYKREVFETIGLFDQNFFAYYEDGDISFRARLAGFKIVLAPKSLLFHRIGGTSSKLGHFARYHSIKNMWFLYLKNMPGWLLFTHLPRFLFVQALLFGSAIRNRALGVAVRSYGELIWRLPSVLRQRHRIQNNRKLSNHQVKLLLTDHWPLKSRLVARFMPTEPGK